MLASPMVIKDLHIPARSIYKPTKYSSLAEGLAAVHEIAEHCLGSMLVLSLIKDRSNQITYHSGVSNRDTCENDQMLCLSFHDLPVAAVPQ
jgi:hypothetical protein